VAEARDAAAEARDAAATRLGEVEGELGALRDHASAAEDTVAGLKAFKEKATAALGAARATLASLQDQGFVPERSTITSAGGEASPSSEGDAEHETLMRSLTAQLEERDDRIRALERRVRGGGGDSNTDALELEERAGRLQEALEHERAARTVADERVIQLLKQTPVGPADLEEKLTARETALEQTEQRVETLSGDVTSLRTVCAETRTGLESLLSDADADEEAARRIGDLLDILRGF
ncbi:MAG: chromosome segregation ATPase, partial [Polyangiales bacterium]